jgi:CubicO group peptidase (beta-lactamase class C family)
MKTITAWYGKIFVGLATGLLAIAVPGRTLTQTSSSWRWPVSTPDEQGLDSAKLKETVDLIRAGERYPRLHALLIVCHGRLVVEEYFNKWQADGLHTLQSVTKSFTSALVGIAIARGEFKGVDEKVLDFFPDIREIANMDERKKSIRLKDLLTMRSGTDYHERGAESPHEQMMRLPKGWDEFYLDRPMLRPPGTAFLYDSGGVILISAMLKNRTGMHAAEYAERFLFAPLGIEKRAWMKNQEGHSHAGGGLVLTARDSAKFGLLYLNHGRWGDAEVVPESWVRESLQKHVDLAAKDQPPFGYGYLWWIFAPDPRGKTGQDIYAARGRFGQYIIVVPEHDMVVVVYAMSVPESGQDRTTELLYDRILTACAADVGDPLAGLSMSTNTPRPGMFTIAPESLYEKGRKRAGH